jgi:tetratricopeptide (TPR) repeat protein
MTTVVRLLGPPRAERDGPPLPVPRGRKPWALLALVLTATGPVPRGRVCDLLFPDAVDPQAALRWTLSQVRRAVGDAIELAGDPLRFRLADDTVVDVLDLLAGRTPTAWPLAEATLPLLEGADPDVPEFGTWLLGRRQSLQVAGARLQRARRRRTYGPAGRTAVRELVEVGEQVMDAGAARDGVRILGGAVQRARTLGDDAVLAEALAHYGRGVVHAVASTDPQAKAALQEADRLATREGLPAVAALARRELGFVASATGDLHTALRALAAAEAVGGRPEDQVGVHSVRGFALVDAGRPAQAQQALDTAVELAEIADRPRALAWALSMRARNHMQRGEEEQAAVDVAGARALVDELRWTAFRPWVDSLHADVLLRAGRLDEAERVLADAGTLAEAIGDDCWYALICRGLAEVRARRGLRTEAAAQLADGCTTFATGGDACLWIELRMRDTFCEIAGPVDREAALREATVLSRLAVEAGLVEFATRAAVHRARFGDRETAAEAAAEARARAAAQDNPVLTALAAGARP